MSKSQEEKDRDEQYEHERPLIELWDCLLQFGLSLFEPEGLCVASDTGLSIGIERLEELRLYFEEKESYHRAGRVHKFIQEYRERWPNAPNGNIID